MLFWFWKQKKNLWFFKVCKGTLYIYTYTKLVYFINIIIWLYGWSLSYSPEKTQALLSLLHQTLSESKYWKFWDALKVAWWIKALLRSESKKMKHSMANFDPLSEKCVCSLFLKTTYNIDFFFLTQWRSWKWGLLTLKSLTGNCSCFFLLSVLLWFLIWLTNHVRCMPLCLEIL